MSAITGPTIVMEHARYPRKSDRSSWACRSCRGRQRGKTEAGRFVDVHNARLCNQGGRNRLDRPTLQTIKCDEQSRHRGFTTAYWEVVLHFSLDKDAWKRERVRLRRRSRRNDTRRLLLAFFREVDDGRRKNKANIRRAIVRIHLTRKARSIGFRAAQTVRKCTRRETTQQTKEKEARNDLDVMGFGFGVRASAFRARVQHSAFSATCRANDACLSKVRTSVAVVKSAYTHMLVNGQRAIPSVASQIASLREKRIRKWTNAQAANKANVGRCPMQEANEQMPGARVARSEHKREPTAWMKRPALGRRGAIRKRR